MLVLAEPHRAAALARDAAAIELAGNGALALAHHVIDRRRDRSQQPRLLALRHLRMEAAGEFLGDEAGRQLAGAPARMRHQRGEERHVVADAVDVERVERFAPARRSPARGVGAWVTSLAIIGS